MEIRNKQGELLETLMEGAPLEKASKIIIFVHGFGTNLHERGLFDDIVKSLSSKRHFAFVRFSWSGFGKSQGKQEDTTLIKVSEDFESILGYIFKNKNKTSEVVIVAFSMGNIVAAKIISGGKYEITKILAVSPADFKVGEVSFKKWVNYRGAKMENDVLIIPRADGTITRVNRAFWDTMDNMNYRGNLEEVVSRIPSVLIRATDDSIVDNNKLKSVKFDQIIELTGGHSFKEQGHRDKFLEIINDVFATKYPVTDMADNIIGMKKKDDILHDDIYRVASLWVRNSKGEVLLAKRALGKRNNPGKWMPVAVSGTVEENESYEQNVIKETNEEIGIDLEKYKCTLIYSRLMEGNHNFHLHVFEACLDLPIESFDFDKFETSEIRWFKTDELTELVNRQPELFTPNAGSIIPEIIKITNSTN